MTTNIRRHTNSQIEPLPLLVIKQNRSNLFFKIWIRKWKAILERNEHVSLSSQLKTVCKDESHKLCTTRVENGNVDGYQYYTIVVLLQQIIDCQSGSEIRIPKGGRLLLRPQHEWIGDYGGVVIVRNGTRNLEETNTNRWATSSIDTSSVNEWIYVRYCISKIMI